MAYYLDQQHYENGNVTIYRRKDGGPNFHCRVKVSAEKRYVVRSCKTTDPEQARQFAVKLYYQAQALKDIGQTTRLWTKQFHVIIDEFEAEIQQEIALGVSTKSRLRRISSCLKNWRRYLDKPVSQITQQDLDEYELWRRKGSTKQLAKTTIQHEFMALNQCLTFAVRKNYLTLDTKPDCSYRVPPKDKGKRIGFNEVEFNTLFKCMNEWRKEDHNSYIIRQREQFRNYVLFMAATGLRVGEARNLRWGQIRYKEEDEHIYVLIDVMDSKTEDKPMVARPEAYFYLLDLKNRDNYTSDDDYVFINKEGKPLTNQKNTFDALLTKCGLLYTGKKKRSITSLRHYYATQCLLDGMDAYVLAENMRTSVKQIKDHYSDVKPEMFKDVLGKRNYDFDKALKKIRERSSGN